MFKLADVLNNPPIPLFSSNPRRQPTEETVVDPREIDKVLSEVAAMIGRWHLFKKFLSEALKVLNYFRCFILLIDIVYYDRKIQPQGTPPIMMPLYL